MNIENCLEKENREKEWRFAINTIYVMIMCGVLRNAYIMGEEFDLNSFTGISFILIFLGVFYHFMTKGMDWMVDCSIRMPRRMRNQKWFFELCRVMTRMPKVNAIYYKSFKTERKFALMGVQVLKQLPTELKIVLRKYPINVRFVRTKKEDAFGTHSIFDKDIKTSHINVYNLRKFHKEARKNLHRTILHEYGHHLDEVLVIEFGINEIYRKKTFSEVDERFLEIYNCPIVYLDNYFMHSPKEYFAETISMYFRGCLEDGRLVNYYDVMFEVLLRKLERK